MTTETRKLQLQTTMDASGVKAGFKEIKDAGKDMAQSVSKSSDQASKAVDGIGGSAKKVGDSWTREEARFRGSLQKATLDLQTLGKAASQKFEAKLELKGLDAAKFQPYINGLKEAERAREALSVAEQAAARSAQGDQLLSSLREQIRLYGKTSEEVAKYRAAQAGVGAEASHLILQLQNMKAATQAKAQADATAAAEAKKLADATRQQAASQQQFLSGLRARVDTQGLDEAGLLRYRAAQLGVSKDAELLIQKLNLVPGVLQRTGVSAAQTAAALRMVPAQFTDIAVSLQGGMNPLTVLLQQGGQLKDSFGGVGPAARALGGYVLGLVNPFTIAAAAVGTLGLAFYQGAKETTEYNKALILTGNYLGTTVSQLQVYAKTIASTVGTQGAAAEALTALASTGKVATTSLTAVGTAVVEMNRVLGQSVEEATKVFVQLADEPTKASAKLNESMNYLNLATYERIRALEEQGQKEQAAALAQTTYANETTSRLRQVEAQAGTLEKGWRFLADAARQAWDAMLNVGRQQSVGNALATAQQKLSEAQAQYAKGGAYATLYGPQVQKQQQAVAELSRKALRESENAAAESERVKTNAAQIGASERLKILTDSTKTNADKRKKAIADLNRDLQTLNKPTSGAEYDKLVANINETYKDAKGAKGKAYTDDAGTKTLETLRQQEAALKAQLETNDKLTAADQERAKYLQLFADLKDKKVLTADQKSLLAQKDAIVAQLDQNVAIEKQLELKKEAAKLDEKRKRDAEEFARQIQGINISIESSSRSRSEQYDRQLSTLGLGNQAREEVESQKAVRREYESYKRQLTKDAAEKNQLGSQAYIDEVARIDEALSGELNRLKQYWAERRAIQADGIKGAQEALANYIDYTQNAYERANRLVGDTLTGLNDSLTEGIWTGDLSSFKDLGDRIGKQIIAGIVEQQITGPLAQWLQKSLQDPNSGIGSILGGLTGTSKTGENWLGGLLGTSTGASGAGAAASTTAMAASATSAAASLTALTAAATTAAAALASSGASSAVGAFGSAAAVGSSLNFDAGGYTGDGGKYQIGGIVHKGEGVLSQEDMRALGGVGAFNALRMALRRGRGYADGGVVGRVGGLTAAANQTFSRADTYNLNFSKDVDRRTPLQVAGAVSLRQRDWRRMA